MEQGKLKYLLIFVGGSSAGSCASGFGVCCVCKLFYLLTATLCNISTCCIFQPEFGCWALQMLVEICNFNVFNGKMLKKLEIYSKILQKTYTVLYGPIWSYKAGLNSSFTWAFNFPRVRHEDLIHDMIKVHIHNLI